MAPITQIITVTRACMISRQKDRGARCSSIILGLATADGLVQCFSLSLATIISGNKDEFHLVSAFIMAILIMLVP